MRRRLGGVGVLVLGAAVLSACHPPEDPNWTVVWQDEFDYASVADMGQVWELSPPWATYTPGEVQLSDDPSVPGGRMVHLRTDASMNWDWTLISTMGPRTPGSEPNYPSARSWQGPVYVEARVRYTENRHVWPAFWMFSHRKAELWPDEDCGPGAPPEKLTAEWDIMENGWQVGDTTSRFSTAVHRNTSDGDDGWCGMPDQTSEFNQVMPASQPLGGWHKWAGWWKADGSLCNYLDDVEIHCAPAFDSFVQPLAVIFDVNNILAEWCAGDPGGCPPLPDELTLDVAWVKVYKPIA